MQSSVFDTEADHTVSRQVSDRAMHTDLERKTRMRELCRNCSNDLSHSALRELYQKNRNILSIPSTNQAGIQKYFTSE